jgi:hypothetical protein
LISLTVKPQQLLVVNEDAFTRQHNPQPSVAEPAMLERDLAKTRPKVAIITTSICISTIEQPASWSRRIAMICSLADLLRFTSVPPS